MNNLRNFCVISHIDHGKTTLTDRFLELAHAVNASKLTQRLLDSNPIEQERGITIKLAPVRLTYHLKSNIYILNLIDTPGHVDFSYEVSRSLAACEGALLLVDATQGIQAQTLSNAYKAVSANLEIIPVINKIDLAAAEVDLVTKQLNEALGFKKEEIKLISAKTGQGVKELLDTIIAQVPAPKANPEQPLKALVFNSIYDTHLGVVAYVRLFAGSLKKGDKLSFISNHHQFAAEAVGYFLPARHLTGNLSSGEVGFVATGLKDISLARVGDTMTQALNPTDSPLPGYREPKPMVFMDLYPSDSSDFIKLKSALEKLRLVDASLNYSPVGSSVLGSGFKIGFQGLLHAEIVQERLEREFDLELISTSPAVEYQVELNKNRELLTVRSPAEFPDPTLINQTKEPVATMTIFTPKDYLGSVLTLSQNHRATLTDQQFFGNQVKLNYDIPLQELISGFFNQLKSATSGFASLDWQWLDYRSADVVKLTVLLNRAEIEPLSVLTVRDKADHLAKELAANLKKVIPRQQFELPIQVALGGKILARETVKAFRKDVTAKLYGGDRTRAMKLLEKQKKGKKRLKRIGSLNLPQEVFRTLVSQS